ncbi:MAG: HlyD family efflux transporter periplasmic adaptor subunit [Alphaproteobacteria bacterium]|nr:HlyD family efflux transporter periplasmic adaptor subunit [Alphaproteobacteria bacterium]
MIRRLTAPALAAVLCACSPQETTTLQGYGEAEYVYIAAQDGGVIKTLEVKEGDTVAAGQALVRLDPDRLQFTYDSAHAAADAARSRVADGGALAESVRQAQANADLAARNLKRTEALVANGTTSRARLDEDRAALKAAQAALAAAIAERDTALRNLGTAEAEEGLARRRLADLTLAAPEAGAIERVYYRAGEVVAAGTPILALLPPANRKVRFFVPEARLASVKPGGQVTVTCDGCPAGLTGTISFIAGQAQYTPPVIYSLEERAKLVFLVEARLSTPEAVRPGLPVDVALP